ncbi:hypothetical protein [Clostridium nigeriense]|uniref:hypothetical protein n=1 Tax=Clostridium nigeriense TaxID=1805470 RepID=UPI000833CE9B|nr:hypothetical protein [Clostridium nigeriense]
MKKYKNKEKIRDEIKDRADKLIKKNRILNFYKNSQFYVPVIVILGAIIYYFFTSGNYSLDMAVTRYEFYIVVIVVFIYIITIEKRVKELEKEVKGEIELFRNKMILKICNCNDFCECKEYLNEYMKKNGVKII